VWRSTVSLPLRSRTEPTRGADARGCCEWAHTAGCCTGSRRRRTPGRVGLPCRNGNLRPRSRRRSSGCNGGGQPPRCAGRVRTRRIDGGAPGSCTSAPAVACEESSPGLQGARRGHRLSSRGSRAHGTARRRRLRHDLERDRARCRTGRSPRVSRSNQRGADVDPLARCDLPVPTQRGPRGRTGLGRVVPAGGHRLGCTSGPCGRR